MGNSKEYLCTHQSTHSTGQLCTRQSTHSTGQFIQVIQLSFCLLIWLGVMLIEPMFFLLSPSSRNVATLVQPQSSQLHVSHALCRKKITCGTNGGLITDATLKSLDLRKDFLFPPSLLLHNTRPVGRQVLQISATCKLLEHFIFIYQMAMYYVSGYPAAADHHHSSGWHFYGHPLIAPVILEFSWIISCYFACSSFVIAFPSPFWPECFIQ